MDLGVIGTGSMGRNHVRIYSELKEVDRVFVYDVDARSSEKAAEAFGAEACGFLASLFESVDAVSICVPTRYHFDTAKEAIERGVHALIEKPITSTSKEGEELLKIIPDDWWWAWATSRGSTHHKRDQEFDQPSEIFGDQEAQPRLLADNRCGGGDRPDDPRHRHRMERVLLRPRRH